MTNIKKSYTTPELSDFGRVSDLTSQLGMTFQTDSTLNGSMEPNDNSMAGTNMDSDAGEGTGMGVGMG